MRKFRFWIPLAVAALLLLSGVVVSAMLPGLAGDKAKSWVAENLQNKALALGEVTFDPWSLTLVFKDVKLADTGAPARPLVMVKALTVDLSPSSLWALHPRLDALTIDAPAIDAVLAADGSLNLAGLIPADDGEPAPEVWIGKLAVVGGRLSFTDRRPAEPVAKMLEPISFALNDFATHTNEGGGFSLEAASETGERFSWRGTLGMAPVASKGQFRFEALKLATISKLAGDLLPFTGEAGSIDMAGSYSVALPKSVPGQPVPPPAFAAELSRLGITGIAVSTAGGDRMKVASILVAPTRLRLDADRLALGQVAMKALQIERPDGSRASLAGLQLAESTYTLSTGVAALGMVALDGFSATGRGPGGETVSLARLEMAASQVDPGTHTLAFGAGSATGLRAGVRLDEALQPHVPGLWPLPAAAATPSAAPEPGWSASLAGLALADSAVRLNVTRSGRVQTINFAPLAITLGPLTSALAAPVRFKASTRIDGKARLTAEGSAAAGAADADIAVSGLQIADYAALAGPLPVTLRSGTLGLKGRAKFGKGPRFEGQIELAGLDVRDLGGTELVSWKALKISGIRASASRLAVRQMLFDGAVSHVIVSPAREINLVTLASAQAAAPAPAKGDIGKLRISAPISDSASSIGAAIPTEIGAVVFRNSMIEFADQSIDPKFSTIIQGVEGEITGLNSRPGSQAEFALKGYVIDRFSPVSITGRANVFAYDNNTDLTATFKNIELPVFNPYSGRYAGYAIAKGKLSTTLHYQIKDRALQADHNLRIDQLVWGEATDSKDKVPLPIRLATGLLKDSNGVIDLDLPVGGSLDDPQFKVWPVVWQIVGNVFTKIITAPFRLIGGLFGGSEAPQIVLFDPGSAVLAASAGAGLEAIAKGFANKPDVNLDIPAGPGLREDAAALATEALHSAALAEKPGKPPVAAAYATLDMEKKLDKLKALYKSKFGDSPKFPEDKVAKAGMFAGGAEKDAARQSQIQWLETALMPRYAATDAQLAALGQARADAIRQVLLANGSMEPTRVFISTALAPVMQQDTVALELKVK